MHSLIRGLLRRLRRWHHLAHVRDLQFVIDHHEKQLVALPTEINRLHQLKRQRLGKAATLAQKRETVNYTLSGVRPQR